MNGHRIVRNYLAKQTDADLLGMWEESKDDIEYEGVIVHYLIECELEKRNILHVVDQRNI